MEKLKLTLLISRALQILFSLVVLGTSITLIKFLKPFKNDNICDNDEYCSAKGIGRLSSSSTFAAFVGGICLIIAVIDLSTEFVQFTPWMVVLGLDGIALVFFAASGVNLMVLRKTWGGACKNGSETFCKSWNADTSFCFLGMLVTGVVIAVLILRKRREKSSGIQSGGYGGREGGGVAML